MLVEVRRRFNGNSHANPVELSGDLKLTAKAISAVPAIGVELPVCGAQDQHHHQTAEDCAGSAIQASADAN
jgi:hypothetical protein